MTDERIKTERKIRDRDRRFALGNIRIGPRALAKLPVEDVLTALGRHAAGDWGDCDAKQWAENDSGVEQDWRLLSVYHDRHGTRFWILTDVVRCFTTIMLPEEF